jgi:TonB family protein
MEKGARRQGKAEQKTEIGTFKSEPMDNFLLYILKSTLCISLLYLVFRILMRKEAFFTLNRMLLIFIVLISMTIPLVPMPQMIKPETPIRLRPALTEEVAGLPESISSAKVEQNYGISTPAKAEAPFISYRQLLQFGYLAGLLISLAILMHGIVSVYLLFRKASEKQMEGFRLVIVEKEIQAFSFNRYIFLSRHDYLDHFQTLLVHEQAHIRLCHFFDLLLLEVVKILHWFNPAIRWLIRDMKEIHEFQADDYTLTKGIDATQYQLLIIQKGVGSQRFALANSFNHCQIKKRIAMINKQKTGKAGSWKAAAFLPLLALLLMAFGRTGENAPPLKELSTEMTQALPQDPVKQWTEADFGKIVRDSVLKKRGFRALAIRINSKSEIVSGGKVLTWEELSHEVKKYLDYSLANEEMKPAFDKITINGQERMAQKSNVLVIYKDESNTPAVYQNLLNNIGKAVMETRQKYADEIYKISYQKLTSAQRNEIDKLVPAIANFSEFPIRATTLQINASPLIINVQKEGIIVFPDKIVSTLDELQKKVELYLKENPNGFVIVKTVNGTADEITNQVKEVLNKAKVLRVTFQTFDQVYVVVDEMPQFPGGESALREWIAQNLNYPGNAKSNGIQGKVFVSFVVNKEGKTVDPKIVRGLDTDLDAEALRLVLQMPEWKAGRQGGVPVSVSYTVPINFVIK